MTPKIRKINLMKIFWNNANRGKIKDLKKTQN